MDEAVDHSLCDIDEDEFRDKENVLGDDWLNALRAKETGTLKLQVALEVEQRERRRDRAEASAERCALIERHQQLEDDLRHRLQEREIEYSQQREEHKVLLASLSVELENVRLREADLLQRHEAVSIDARRLQSRCEADALELQTLRAQINSSQCELLEVRELLRTSDDVREALLRELNERTGVIELRCTELKELRLEERMARESGQARHERLSAQCESLARQAQDKGREVDVLEERVKRLEEALKVKGLEADSLRRRAEEERRDFESKLAKSADEVAEIRNILAGRDTVEASLRDRLATLEAQLEREKAEEARVRQDLFLAQSAKEETEHVLGLSKRREQLLLETIASLEARLAAARSSGDEQQESLLVARLQLQTAELRCRGEHESAAGFEREIARVRCNEEALQKDALRRSENSAAQRDAEIALLCNEVAMYRENVRESSVAVERNMLVTARQRTELQITIQSGEDELQRSKEAAARFHRDLLASEHQLEDAQSAKNVARESLGRTEEELRHEMQIAASLRTELLSEHAELDAVQEALKINQNALTEVSVQGELWAKEVTALHLTVHTLQASIDAFAHRATFDCPPEPLDLRADVDPGLGVGNEIASKAFQTQSNEPGSRSQSRKTSANLVAPVRDEIPLSFSFDNVGSSSDISKVIRARFANFIESHLHSLGNRSLLWYMFGAWASVVRNASSRGQVMEPLPSGNTREDEKVNSDALSRLLSEFRHRVAGVVAACLDGCRAPDIAEELGVIRKRVGRLLYAALLLYQKARILVRSELKESLQCTYPVSEHEPFYALPYKSRRISSEFHVPTSLDEVEVVELQHLLRDLEARFLSAVAKTIEVPSFLVKLLAARFRASCLPGPSGSRAGKACVAVRRLQDQLDVLLVDTLTLFMSGSGGFAKGTPLAHFTAEDGCACAKPAAVKQAPCRRTSSRGYRVCCACSHKYRACSPLSRVCYACAKLRST